MPSSDVVYVGGYIVDQYKVRYMVNGELYEEDPYDEGDLIFPKPAPEKEGYVFGGWSRIPPYMPADDVVVTGELIPNLYELSYTIGDHVAFVKQVPCGADVKVMEAPEIHGMVFGGWIGEPRVMPPHDVEVRGRYTSDQVRYKTVATAIPMGDTIVVEKERAVPPVAIAFVSGSFLRLVIENVCYPVPGASDCIRNSRVIDEEGLYTALRNTYRKRGLPKRRLYMVINPSADRDVAFPTSDTETADLTRMAEELLQKNGETKGLTYRHHMMAESATEDKRYVLTSALEEATVNTFVSIFARLGVTVYGYDTLMGALAEYLQRNKRMERGTSQIGLYYLPTTILGTLVMDGQVVYMMQNRYPYEDRAFSLVNETAYIVRSLNDYAEKRGFGGPLTTVTIGGIDRTHVRACERLMPHLLRSMVRDKRGGLFKDKRYRKPLIVNLGFGATENRTK